jgi:L-fuconolactonase
MIVDAQVHVYEVNTPARPWIDPNRRLNPPEMTGEQMLAAMDAIGVDRTILVSAFLVYGMDTTYADEVYRAWPDRFRVVAPADPLAKDVGGRIAARLAQPGAVGVRILFLPDGAFGADHSGVVAAVEAARAAGLPVNVHCYDRLEVIADLARRFPDVQFVLDHLGMAQPRVAPAPAGALKDLNLVLALAAHPNIALKLTGACTYARGPFPYEDLWEPLGRLIEAFGVGRCMWGTDWQRTTATVSYPQALSAFRDHWPLSSSERAAILSGTAMRLYGWPEGETGALDRARPAIRPSPSPAVRNG